MPNKIDPKNVEANYFAMHLLVPDEFLAREKFLPDLADDKGLRQLADKFDVPLSVMAFRIGEYVLGKRH